VPRVLAHGLSSSSRCPRVNAAPLRSGRCFGGCCCGCW
jgi:hypothetical protein